MAFAETQELAVKLSLKDELSRGLGNAARNLKALDKATGNTQRSLGKFSSNIQKGVAVGLAATAGAFVSVVKAASDYESAFAGVRKTVDATEPELQALSDAFRKLSKEIPISAAELARLGEAGGALGIAAADLEEFVRVTALLGVTTDLTSDQAADSLGILGNVLKLTGDEYEQFASSLVALGNAGASTESQIIGIAERAGAAGELIGLSTDQVLGFSSAVASIGVETEAGGSALQKFFIDTTKFVAQSGDELKIFAKVAGVSAKEFKRAYENDAGQALEDFLAGLGKLDQAAQLNILEDLGFNDVRITRTLLGLANNTTLLAGQMDIANKAFKENTALTKEAEQRFKTFDSQLQITKNILTDVGITIGSKLLPKLVPLLQKLNAFVTENQGEIEKFGDQLASGLERLATAVGKVDWQPFIEGFKVSAQLAKGAFDAFNALPDDFKKLILVGAGINKVTGGLITSLGKDLFGAALNQFAARGSSPANPMWVAMAGGPSGPTPPGGKGGILGNLLKGAAAVTLVGVTAQVAAELAGVTRDSPNRQIDPNTGNIVRTVTDVGQKIVNLQNSEKMLAERAAGGDAIARRQLESVRAELAKLQGQQATAAANALVAAQAANQRLALLHGAAIRTKDDTVAAQNRTATILAQKGNETRAAVLSAAISQSAAVRQQAALTRSANQAAAFAIRDRVTSAGNRTKAAVDAARGSIAAAAIRGGNISAAAIRAKKMTANVRVVANSYITVKGLASSVSFSNKFGATAS